MTKNDLIIEISANTKKAVKEIEQLKKEIKNFSENVKKGNVSLKTQDEYLNKVAKRLTQMAHAYASFSAIKGAVDIVADFEQSIAKLGAISGASKENLDKLKQKAEELGKSTMFSASEVAEGMNYLAMAGYKTKDIMASIGDVLNLAAVGQINLGQASDIASNILSGFNLKAEETKRVVDVMTATMYALKKAVMVYELIAGSVALARFIRLAKVVRNLSAAFTLLGNALKGLDKASKIIYLISLAVGAATYVYEKFTNTTEELTLRTSQLLQLSYSNKISLDKHLSSECKMIQMVLNL